MGFPPRTSDRITYVTLWEDGRAVFTSPGGPFRETRLNRGTLSRLLGAASVLYTLADFYAAAGMTDAPTTRFSVETERGRKTVQVYAMNPEAAHPGEQSHAELERLRGLWREVVAALPRSAPTMQPDEVIVALSPGVEHTRPNEPGCAALGVRQTWPAALSGRLVGEAAREAVRRGGLGPYGGFCVDGTAQTVWVRPVLPVLHLPDPHWPRSGLPRHPAATAYESAEHYVFSYRYPGASKTAVAAWYRGQMEAKGWRLARESGDDLQFWVRPRLDESDPMVELRFGPAELEMRYVRTEGGVPHHPAGVLGGCAGSSCLLVRNTPPDAAAVWFREYLGYLGYTELEPHHYQHGRTLLRLEFRPESGGTAITMVRSIATSPPPGLAGGHPYVAARSTPLCEATKGREVAMAGRTISLHSSLCVTVRDPDRLRIQVAYGDSYLDLEPATGRQIQSYGTSDDQWYTGHLQAIVVQFIPGAPPPPPGPPTPGAVLIAPVPREAPAAPTVTAPPHPPGSATAMPGRSAGTPAGRES
jgi:hypothetical protein